MLGTCTSVDVCVDACVCVCMCVCVCVCVCVDLHIPVDGDSPAVHLLVPFIEINKLQIIYGMVCIYKHTHF